MTGPEQSAAPGQSEARPPAGFGMARGGIRPGAGGAEWLQPVAKPRNTRKTLAQLSGYFKSETKRLLIILGLVVGSGCLALSLPWLIGRAIDAMPGRVDVHALGVAVFTLSAAYLIDAGLTIVQGWLMAGVSQQIIAGLRRSLFAKLQRLPVSYFDTHGHGDLMSRVTNDIDNVSSTISQSTTQLMSTVIVISGSLTMMFVLSPLLALASLVTVPLVFLLSRTVSLRTRVLFKEQQAILGALNGHIEENVSGILVVKAFNHQERAFGEFALLNDRLCEVGLKAQIWSGYIMPLMNVINNVGFATVAGVGGVLAVKGLITIGVIASFLGYSRQFARPLNDLANIYNSLQTALAGAERVFEVLDEVEEPQDPPGTRVLEKPRGEVEFREVEFGYRPEVAVLAGINFSAPAGAVIALVGPTGAGKTTLVNLLARFYDVSRGSIRLDGQDIRDYSRDSLRRCFGIVLQDTYLFSGTIRENILYGKPEASEEELIHAAVVANADGFIRHLPKGYDTHLSESGSSLSQGQRQLLAIARVILTDPAILILDEATSSVDTRTELHIQEAMLALTKGRTSFIIAHRLSTVRGADRILVIDGGRIVETGNHTSLIRAGGVYARMYENQA
jgi:ATP-binding cassette subfamily B multidrug efflux pump